MPSRSLIIKTPIMGISNGKIPVLGNVTDCRVLATPGVLAGKIKLEAALPVAGFVDRKERADPGGYEHEYIRSGKFKFTPGTVDGVLADMKDDISEVSSSESNLLSFVILKSWDEVDTVIVWERHVSRETFNNAIKPGRTFSGIMERINSNVETGEVVTYRRVGGYVSR
jgi:hypothetical protein